MRNIGIDCDARRVEEFECDYRVERIHGCAHQFLAEHPFEGTELIYSDPPYLKRTRTSRRRSRFDYEEGDHIALLELLEGVALSGDGVGLPLGAVRRAPRGVGQR